MTGHNYGRPSWSWSYGSWIYNYFCNQCLSPLKLWVRIPLVPIVLDITLCDKVCQCFRQVGGFLQTLRFSPPIKLKLTELLLEVALYTMTLILTLILIILSMLKTYAVNTIKLYSILFNLLFLISEWRRWHNCQEDL